MAEEKTTADKRRRLSKVFFALAGILALGGVALLVLFYTSVGAGMKDRAFVEGKQARIVLATGAVEGNLVQVETPVKEEPKEETALPPEEKTPTEAPPPEDTEEPATEEKEDGLHGSREGDVPGIEKKTERAAAQLPPPEVKTPLNGALNSSLYETVEGVGKLPVISESGLESWQYYGKQDTSDKARPAIALVVTGMGLNRSTTGKALLLPEQVSLSFSPYAGELQQQMTSARSYGHEVWMDMPLEPADYPAVDAGPLTLRKDMKDEALMPALYKILARATAYVGLVGTEDEIFSDYAPMRTVVEELKKRGVLTLLRSQRYAGAATADRVFYVNRALDALPEGNGPNSAQLLLELEASAREYGYAVGVLGDAPQLFTQISEWSKTLEGKNIALVPATAIISRLKK